MKNYIEVKTENGLVFINTDTILRIHFEDELAKIVVNNSINNNNNSVIATNETIDSIKEKLKIIL
jgi:hypothetical protein